MTKSKKVKVLIVDDEQSNIDIITETLAEEPFFSWEIAKSGIEALQRLERFPPDIILLDLMMPEMDGYEVCRRIRSDSRYRFAKIIIISGKSLESERLEAYQAGADDYVTKPFSEEELLAKLKVFTHLAQTAELTELQLKQQKTKAALVESEKRYQTIFEESRSIMFIIDPARAAIIDANPAACKYYGYSRQELSGMNIMKINILPAGKIFQAIFEVVENKKGHFFFQHRLANGDIRDVEVYTNTIDWGSKRLLFSIIHDITEQKKLAAQYRHAQKMEAIGTLAGGIAHDFNNILSGIIGFTKMAIEDLPPDTPILEDLHHVVSLGNRATDLVKQILTLSRKNIQKLEHISIFHITKETIKFLRASIPSNIIINQKLDPQCGTIEADPTHIHQVLMNLFTNAFHAMENTGGTLNVSLSNCRIDKYTKDVITKIEEGLYVKLKVEDTGHGIDDKTMENIFDPYFTTKDVEKGTGLGLAIVHGIVSSLKGSIKIESKKNKGTTFTVYFKRIHNDTNNSLDVSQQPCLGVDMDTGTGMGMGKGEHIIFVDDETFITRLAEKKLSKLNYQVTSFTDSNKALEEIRLNPNRFNILITDLSMPGLSGVELFKEVVKINPELAAILCTGYKEKISRQKALKIGFAAFFNKPYPETEMATTIRSLLTKNKPK